MIKDRLEETINTGEILTIKYDGGSMQGQPREIFVLKVLKDRIRAKCLTTNAVKTFIIDKIEICDEESLKSLKPIELPKKKVYEYENLEDFYEQNKDTLEDLLNWTIKFESDSLSLHRRFKNGNPLKTADVEIYFEEYEETWSAEKNEPVENGYKRVKPWVVRAKNINTRAFKNINRALEFFYKQSEKFAPKIY